MNGGTEPAQPRRNGRPATVLWWTAAWLVSLPVLLSLSDPVLADSLAFRCKARILSWGELFLPGQSQLVNPYYRPLFVALHRIADTWASDLGLRVLAVLCHLAAASALAVLLRVAGTAREVGRAAILLFLALPGSTVTAIWPVVGYWSLAAAFCLLGMAAALTFVRSGRRWALLAAIAATIASLGCSETAYFLPAFALLLALLPSDLLPVGLDRAARRRAFAVALTFAGMVFVHLRWLETGAQSLASGSILELGERVLRRAPVFWTLPFGGDRFVGLALLPWIVLGVQAVRTVGRRHATGWLALGIAASLPFAVVGINERYAYLSSALLCVWAAQVWLAPRTRGSGQPTDDGSRSVEPRPPSRLTRLAFAALVAIAVTQSAVRALHFHGAAVRSGRVAADLEELRSEWTPLDEVAFVNLPAMSRWVLADLLELRSSEAFDRAWQSVTERMVSVVHTDEHWFPAAPLPPGTKRVFEFERDRVLLRSPDQPLGQRTAQPSPWFLARDFVVVEREWSPWAGQRSELLHRDRVLDASRKLADPSTTVVLERAPSALEPPLPQHVADARFEPLVADQDATGIEHGVTIGGRLVVDLDVERTALFVVAIQLAGGEDEVPRVLGDVGRFCDLLVAELDGGPVPIEPVFYHCAGVVVPAGEHRLVIRQRGR